MSSENFYLTLSARVINKLDIRPILLSSPDPKVLESAAKWLIDLPNSKPHKLSMLLIQDVENYQDQAKTLIQTFGRKLIFTSTKPHEIDISLRALCEHHELDSES